LREEKIFEFHNVLDAAYGAYIVHGAYSANHPAAGKSRGEAVAIIREFARGNTADIYRSARDASSAVSTVQLFVDAVDVIGSKLATMRELATKASNPDYSQVQIEEMQKQFQGLAKEINDTVNGAEYNFNKLLTAEGKAISISVSDNIRADIFARDLSLDAEGVDLTSSASGALSKVNKAIENLDEYAAYLKRQATRLEEAAASIGRQLENAMGVDTSEFGGYFGKQVTNKPTNQILENKSALVESQANVHPQTALKLLKT